MEVGQGEDDGPELCLLGTALQDLLIELPVSPSQVGLETIGGLICELDGVLEQRYGQGSLQLRGWLC